MPQLNPSLSTGRSSGVLLPTHIDEHQDRISHNHDPQTANDFLMLAAGISAQLEYAASFEVDNSTIFNDEGTFITRCHGFVPSGRQALRIAFALGVHFLELGSSPPLFTKKVEKHYLESSIYHVLGRLEMQEISHFLSTCDDRCEIESRARDAAIASREHVPFLVKVLPTLGPGESLPITRISSMSVLPTLIQ